MTFHSIIILKVTWIYEVMLNGILSCAAQELYFWSEKPVIHKEWNFKDDSEEFILYSSQLVSFLLLNFFLFQVFDSIDNFQLWYSCDFLALLSWGKVIMQGKLIAVAYTLRTYWNQFLWVEFVKS